jgi:hypothetical protein
VARIRILFAVSTTLAALVLSVGGVMAAIDAYKPPLHPMVTKQPAPNASAKTPTNPPPGKSTVNRKPKAIENSGAGK